MDTAKGRERSRPFGCSLRLATRPSDVGVGATLSTAGGRGVRFPVVATLDTAGGAGAGHVLRGRRA